ncbi:RNA-directed DNA polymerase from mobile element jockey [Trichonephila inaurata madagascariensis]|uniref:RNA-directed DNA polymerase from mobile element jockey n=1 Tax=Trichonephila inaurata madagascariensis TaxID=2747483 RepID=A0A8X7CCA5_9ARAC|nr:RNA-directed DNA polymerase from mobile element jockey [Trichonephila inaurata madagascariensis]
MVNSGSIDEAVSLVTSCILSAANNAIPQPSSRLPPFSQTLVERRMPNGKKGSKQGLKSGIQCSLYVRDVQISYSSKFLNVAERQIQTTINNFTKWAEHNGFVFSTEKKNGSVVFSRKHGVFPNLELFIGRSLIKVVNEFKFLGLIFDQSLRFHRHLKDLKIGSAKALNILIVLANTRWGADRTSLLRLYRALIRSKLDFGSVVYSSACKSLLKILDPVHHQALRLCLGAFRTSPVESFYAEAYEPPLDLRRKLPVSPSKHCLFTFIVSSHPCGHHIYALANHLKKKDIRFCRIPGYAGITGNELADTAARSATGSSERFPIPHSDLKACFRQKLQSV